MSHSSRLFGRGERDVAVEHLVHAVKLAEVRGVVSSPRKEPSMGPSAAMLQKFARRKEEEDRRIKRENKILVDKIVQQYVHSEKMTVEARAALEKQRATYAGSNFINRLHEAVNIDRENKIIATRIETAKPYVYTSQDTRNANQTHRKRLDNMCKFKPAVEFEAPHVVKAPQPPPERPQWHTVGESDTRPVKFVRKHDPATDPPHRHDTAADRTRTTHTWCDRDAEHRNFAAAVAQQAASS